MYGYSAERGYLPIRSKTLADWAERKVIVVVVYTFEFSRIFPPLTVVIHRYVANFPAFSLQVLSDRSCIPVLKQKREVCCLHCVQLKLFPCIQNLEIFPFMVSA
jgi:hypothetical protein